MKTGQNKRKVDSLLALLLLGVFAVCILSVLLTGADTYRRLSSGDRRSYDSRTAARYLTTRVRQSDRMDAVSLRPFGAANALVFTETIENSTYETLVYCHDGYLRELFTAAGGSFLPEDGEKVIAAQALSFSLDGQVLDAELTDASGDVQRLHLYLRSGKEAVK